jgi:hypothetical protein
VCARGLLLLLLLLQVLLLWLLKVSDGRIACQRYPKNQGC